MHKVYGAFWSEHPVCYDSPSLKKTNLISGRKRNVTNYSTSNGNIVLTWIPEQSYHSSAAIKRTLWKCTWRYSIEITDSKRCYKERTAQFTVSTNHSVCFIDRYVTSFPTIAAILPPPPHVTFTVTTQCKPYIYRFKLFYVCVCLKIALNISTVRMRDCGEPTSDCSYTYFISLMKWLLVIVFNLCSAIFDNKYIILSHSVQPAIPQYLLRQMPGKDTLKILLITSFNLRK